MVTPEQREYNKKYREEHKEKDAVYQHEYYLKTQEEDRRYHREYYQAHKKEICEGRRVKYATDPVHREKVLSDRNKHYDKRRAYEKAYYEKNKESRKAYARVHRERLWIEARSFFGPCACCGESRLEFLTLDHIHGNGKEDRLKNHRDGTGILTKLRYDGWPENAKKEYRLLCFNCNCSIGIRGYCPHQRERDETSITES
jgi:hypothetical protein